MPCRGEQGRGCRACSNEGGSTPPGTPYPLHRSVLRGAPCHQGEDLGWLRCAKGLRQVAGMYVRHHCCLLLSLFASLSPSLLFTAVVWDTPFSLPSSLPLSLSLPLPLSALCFSLFSLFSVSPGRDGGSSRKGLLFSTSVLLMF